MYTIEMIVLMILAVMGGLVLFLQLTVISFILGAAHWDLE